MKKIIAILIYFTFFANSAFADIGDVLYVKKFSSLVREKPYINSTIIAELKTGYVVLDKGASGTRWTKILLTDGKIGYIYNFNIGKNMKSKYEVKGNYGVLDKTAEIRQLPSEQSKLIGILYEKNNFELMHLNYIFGIWAKVKILDGMYKGEIGYINKEKIILSCNYENGYDVFKSTFNFKNIPDTSYCSRIKVSGSNNNSSNISSSISTTEDEDVDNFLDSLDNIMNDNSSTTRSISTTEDDDVDNFLDSLDNIMNDNSDIIGGTTNTSTTTSTNNTNTTSNTSMEDFLDNLGNIFN